MPDLVAHIAFDGHTLITAGIAALASSLATSAAWRRDHRRSD